MESYDTKPLRQLLDMYDKGTVQVSTLASMLFGESRKAARVCRCESTKECCPQHGNHVMPHQGCILR